MLRWKQTKLRSLFLSLPLSMFSTNSAATEMKNVPLPKGGGIHMGQSPSQHHRLCPQPRICHMAITILNGDLQTHGCHSIPIVSSDMPFLFLELYFNDVARHCSFKVQTFSTKQPLCVTELNRFLYKNGNAILQYYHKVTKHK